MQARRQRSLIKYVGGKAWLAPFICDGIRNKLAETSGRYIEPFLGGGAVALDLALPNMLLADVNKHLIHMFVAVRDYPRAVARELQRMTVGRDAFLRQRSKCRVRRAAYAAQFVYLSRLSFNGLLRVNASGAYNMPYGLAANGAPHPLPDITRFMDVHQAIRTSEIRCWDFRKTISMAKPGDVLFCDSPYDGTFTSYTASKFDETDQRDLAACIQAAVSRNVRFIATNASTPLVRSLYSWATVLENWEPRYVSCVGADRGAARCVLITNDTSMICRPT